jgi:sporulation protein YlmC with PRC-barrel domain
MKPNTKIFIISLLPLLTPLTAAAENDGKVKNPTATTDSAAIPSLDSKSRSISWRASEILGTNVKNANDETVGEVKDFIVNWNSHEMVAIVISTGGFLGVADNLSSVSPATLTYDAETKVFRTSLTKADLEKQPRFTSKTWSDFHVDEFSSSLRVAQDKSGSEVTAPDNSAQNEKDLNQNTTTPLDQGHSDGDVKLTKDIRSAVVDSKLSFNAKNIKIITNGGNVTLRGVVESEAEHLAILKIVQAHADSSKITDQLKTK